MNLHCVRKNPTLAHWLGQSQSDKTVFALRRSSFESDQRIIFPFHLPLQVVEHYSKRPLDDDMRSQMALDWIAREQETAGILGAELKMAEAELEAARSAGRELRFPKEKKDILMLAASQMNSPDSN